MKQKIDSFNLHWQNLLYEANYLKKEINRCFEFKSRHEDIQLVPEEEFYSVAPPEISRPVNAVANNYLTQFF